MYDDNDDDHNEEDKPKGKDEQIAKTIKPMLYIHHGAFMKVLGCTIDVNILEHGDFLPVLYDAQGNKLEP